MRDEPRETIQDTVQETAQETVHEIVIVRRRHGGDHDDAHGGVWKVAFADFMTAMMAFFLVLWIVNSTSKETRASVARYFNPVRLSDTTPARKGLQEPREEDFDARAVEVGKKVADPAAPEKTDAPLSSHPPQADRADRRETPLATRDQMSAAPAGKAPGPAEAFRDPFEQFAPVRPAAAAAPAPAKSPAAQDSAPQESAALGRAVAVLARQASARNGPAMDVRETAEGLLISLTDRADYGMFAIGSAEPNASLVRLMADLGSVLKPLRAAVVVRGHTDARQYRKAGFDNWRLSTGRAQSAADMLLRGGLDERRIERIEGYADHRLRNPKEPEAAENRRVEILLRKEGA